MRPCPSCGGDCGYTKKKGCQYKSPFEFNPDWDASAPMVMTPHPNFQKRSWVGLTDEEIHNIAWPHGGETMQAIIKHTVLQAEQLLKEKNT
jgi:hypothetical protein